MRLQLFLLFVTMVSARRMTSSSSSHHAPVQRGVLNPWGCPYCWGIEDDVMPDELEDHPVKKVKPVKRVKKTPPVKKGRFGLPETPDGHPHWLDIDKALDGLE